ncbi:MAG: hypothetical protein JXR69_09925 [Candidatus Delongbacteria bacterium]|nr:hypothetical protein [Candidatus Delongbacteria bacterium]
MRKSVVIIAVFLFSVSMFAGITKNELVGGVKYFYNFDAGDPSNELTNVNIPYVDYKFEIMLGKLFKIYAHPSIGYKMYKVTVDGEAPIGYDRYATEFYFSVKPMLKFYFPKQLLTMDGFFAKGALPIYSGSISPQKENPAPAEHIRTVDISFNLGYDNRKIDQHLLTPWDSFEQGWAAYLTYDEHLIKTVSDPEESNAYLTTEPRFMGISGCYSHLVKKENMMVKMSLDYLYQLNPDWSEGGKDTTIDLGVLFAYDIIKEVNAGANLGFRVKELEMTDAFGYGSYNYFVFGAHGHYYPLPLFDVYGAFELDMDLTSDTAEPNFKFEVGGAVMFK